MKLNVLFFLLWISCHSVAVAQSAEQCMEIARMQIKIGNDAEARTLLQRVVYFDRKTFGEEAYYHLSYINFRLKSYPQSEFYFDLLYHNAGTDTLKYEALIGKAGALLMQTKYTQAISELLNLPEDIPPYWNTRKALYLGSAYYGVREFTKAETLLLSIIPAEQKETQSSVKHYLKKARKINRKNPKTAQVMSMVLPGAGQFYAGDIKNGFNSLGLNAVMAWWFIYTLQKTTFGDAVLSTGSWVFRYYAGGFGRVPQITEDVKTKKLNRNFQDILGLMESTGSVH